VEDVWMVRVVRYEFVRHERKRNENSGLDKAKVGWVCAIRPENSHQPFRRLERAMLVPSFCGYDTRPQGLGPPREFLE
jgi:hypothetical protein